MQRAFIRRQNFDFQVNGSVEIIVCQHHEMPTQANAWSVEHITEKFYLE